MNEIKQTTRIFDIFKELWDRYPFALMQERPFLRFFLIYFPLSGRNITRDGGSLSFYTQINQRFIQLSQLRPPGNQSHLYVALDQGYIEQKEFEIIYE